MEEKLSRELAQNQDWAKQAFGNSADFYAKPLKVCGIDCCLMMFDGLSSLEKLWDVLLRQLAGEPDFRKGEQLFAYILQKSALPVEPQAVCEKQAAAEKLPCMAAGSNLLVPCLHAASAAGNTGRSKQNLPLAAGRLYSDQLHTDVLPAARNLAKPAGTVDLAGRAAAVCGIAARGKPSFD